MPDTERQILSDSTYMRSLECQTPKTEAGQRGKREMLFNGYRVSVFQDENVLEVDFTAV